MVWFLDPEIVEKVDKSYIPPLLEAILNEGVKSPGAKNYLSYAEPRK